MDTGRNEQSIVIGERKALNEKMNTCPADQSIEVLTKMEVLTKADPT
jgi:hypothetical protein